MKELEGDEDEIFLRDGLLSGFQLVSTDTVFSPAQMENYRSSTDLSVRDKVEQTILEEIKGAVPDQTAREPRGEHLPSSSLL